MPERSAVRPRKMQSIKKCIDKRAELQAQIDAITQRFQPKLDKILQKRERRLGRRPTKVRDLTTKILVQIYALSGSEIAQLRRDYPTLPEVGQRGRSG